MSTSIRDFRRTGSYTVYIQKLIPSQLFFYIYVYYFHKLNYWNIFSQINMFLYSHDQTSCRGFSRKKLAQPIDFISAIWMMTHNSKFGDFVDGICPIELRSNKPQIQPCLHFCTYYIYYIYKYKLHVHIEIDSEGQIFQKTEKLISIILF